MMVVFSGSIPLHVLVLMIFTVAKNSQDISTSIPYPDHNVKLYLGPPL
jgi:hypothetical protein